MNYIVFFASTVSHTLTARSYNTSAQVPDVWTFTEPQAGPLGAMNRPTAGARFEEAVRLAFLRPRSSIFLVIGPRRSISYGRVVQQPTPLTHTHVRAHTHMLNPNKYLAT